MSIPKELTGSINLTKIDKSFVTKGKNGDVYLDLRFVNTPDNKYGSDYMITQALPKSVRDQVKATGGEYPETPILGNAKAWKLELGVKNTIDTSVSEPTNEGDDLPF